MEDEDAVGFDVGSEDRTLLVGLYGSSKGSVVNERGVANKALVDLALDVVDEYLGPVVGAVAETLARHGELDLKRLEGYAKRLGQDTVDAEKDCGRGKRAFSHLTRNSIKSALVNLVRHNVVLMDTTEVAPPDGQTGGKASKSVRPQRATYRFSPQRALMLMRHPSICSIVEKRAGAVHSVIVEEVLISGASSKKSVLDSVAVRVASAKDTFAVAAFATAFSGRPDIPSDWIEDIVDVNTSIQDILQRPEALAARQVAEKAFEELVHRRILVPQKKFSVKTIDSEKELEDTTTSDKKKKTKKEAEAKKARQPRATTPTVKRKAEELAPAEKEVNLLSSQPPAKRAKGGPIELARKLKQKKLESAQATAAKANPRSRKSVSTTSLSSTSSGTVGGSNGGKASSSSGTESNGNSKKDDAKKKEASEFDVEEFPPGDPRGALWFKVNLNYFLQCFRADLIVDHFADRGEDPFFGEVLSVVMQANINASVGSRRDDRIFDLPLCTHIPVTFDNLLKELAESEGLARISDHGNEVDRQEALDSVLDALQSISNGIVQVDSVGNDRTVNVNLDAAVRVLKRRCFLKQLESEHGIEGMRIVNLLLDKKALEESQVGDLAMLAPPKARTILQDLLRDGYLMLEEVSKRPDLNPSYTYFIYRALDSHIEQVVVANAMQAMLNLRIQLRVQNQECKRYEEVAIQVDRFKENLITKEDLRKVQGFQQFTRIRFNVDNLERAILNLDKTCVLLGCLDDVE